MRLTAGMHAKVLLVSRSPSTHTCKVKSICSNMGIMSLSNISKIACSICLDVPLKFPLQIILKIHFQIYVLNENVPLYEIRLQVDNYTLINIYYNLIK